LIYPILEEIENSIEKKTISFYHGEETYLLFTYEFVSPIWNEESCVFPKRWYNPIEFQLDSGINLARP
jgi:hypothetical protein